jgi:hypothetical protein
VSTFAVSSATVALSLAFSFDAGDVAADLGARLGDLLFDSDPERVGDRDAGVEAGIKKLADHGRSENKTSENGERLIWLEPNVVDRLRALRGRGESYSQVIFEVVGTRAPRVLTTIVGSSLI